MMSLLRLCLPTLGLLLLAESALGWEVRLVERKSETACVISTQSAPLKIELVALPDDERQTRIRIARRSGLEGGSIYFIAPGSGRAITTNTGLIEGPGAADMVNRLLYADTVLLGYSRDNSPLETKIARSLVGFSDAFWRCFHILGWQPQKKPTRGAAQAPPEQPAETAAESVEDSNVDDEDSGEAFQGLLAAAQSSGLPAALVTDLKVYHGLTKQKAFALASDDPAASAWGFSHGRSGVEEAIAAALADCRAVRRKRALAAQCQVVLVGTAQVGDLPASQDTLMTSGVGEEEHSVTESSVPPHRSTAPTSKPPENREEAAAGPASAEDGVAAYLTHVESAEDDVVTLENGATARVLSGFLGFVRYRSDAVLFQQGGSWKLWIEGEGEFRCDLRRAPPTGVAHSAKLVQIRDVKDDGSSLFLGDGSRLDVDSVDTPITSLWLAPSEALLVDDVQLVNLDEDDEIVRVTVVR